MSISSFTVSRTTEAVFDCNPASANVYFACHGKRVGKLFTFSRAEAADLGARIRATGEWDEFPVDEIVDTDVMNFGERLRLYGVNGD